MNSHRHARLTYARRLRMVRQMIELNWSAGETASAHGVTPATARKWLGRRLAGGGPGRCVVATDTLATSHRAGHGIADRRVARAPHNAGPHRSRRGCLGEHLQPSAGASRGCATRTNGPAICCTSTPGSSGASRGPAIASRATGATRWFARAYRPQTSGKAERFIQSALREWAYGWTYRNSAQRTRALAGWQCHS